ncbi:protein rep [Streptomyces sp. ADI95-16]|uniref:protein rep n=1 Tax=Streptomyces sp. ADI95-16 TaxID=1522758 RepID=UPI001C1F5CEC|nr:protein rep [Streptomyces sp. ADI95-16]
MTSVRETSADALQRPAVPGPRCRCGTKITHVPGKVPRTYCSDRCRKAAKRALAYADLSGGNPGHLGKRTTEFSESDGPKPPPAVVKPDIRRWQGRRILNRVSGITACRACGRSVLDPDTGVIVGRTTRGYVVTLGVARCGRIWFCAQCSAAIRTGRTEELKTAALRWLAAGGILIAVVLTARHNHTTRLAGLSDALWGAPLLDAKGAPVLDRSDRPRRAPGAYQRMLSDPAFYGRPEGVNRWTLKDGTRKESIRPEVEGIRHRIGYAGMVRASEVTRSQEAGWHPHVNGLLFAGATLLGTPAKGAVTGYFDPSDSALEEWEDWLRALWARSLKAADPSFEPSTKCGVNGCKCRGKGHGVQVTVIRSADDVALVDYLTKVQDGKPAGASVQQDLEAAGGAAMETLRADNKRGRGRKSMVPFQMLYRLWDLEAEGLDEDQAEGYGTALQLRAWWAEYEQAMAGRRAIEWTRGLRLHVGLTGDDSEERDMEFVYEQAAREPLTGGVVMSTTAYSTVVRGMAEPEVEEIVSAGIYDSVGDLVYGLGGLAGHVRPLTAQEIADVQEHMAARMLAQREERERQARIDKFEAERELTKQLHTSLATLLLRLSEAPRTTA